MALPQAPDEALYKCAVHMSEIIAGVECLLGHLAHTKTFICRVLRCSKPLKTAAIDDVQQVDGAPLSAAPCGYARLSERAHKASVGLTLPKRDEGMQYSTSDASVHRHLDEDRSGYTTKESKRTPQSLGRDALSTGGGELQRTSQRSEARQRPQKLHLFICWLPSEYKTIFQVNRRCEPHKQNLARECVRKTAE